MTGLIDLFEDADPEPGTLDPDADVFDRGRAVLRTLRRLAGGGPVVVAIDDIQWLDAISAPGAALRRPAARPRARRPAGDGAPVAGENRTSSSCRRTGSSRSSSARCRSTRSARSCGRSWRTISRPALERIYELSGGNPMYAIELARSAEVLADPLGAAAPPTLRGVLAARLGDATRRPAAVLRTAAALGPAPTADLARACDRSAAPSG